MVNINRALYSNESRELAVACIEEMRHIVVLPDNARNGLRFKNTESVLARLESMYTETEFKINPPKTVIDALTDAAECDWWYDEEKDYREYNDTDTEEESEVDYD